MLPEKNSVWFPLVPTNTHASFFVENDELSEPLDILEPVIHICSSDPDFWHKTCWILPVANEEDIWLIVEPSNLLKYNSLSNKLISNGYCGFDEA